MTQTTQSSQRPIALILACRRLGVQKSDQLLVHQEFVEARADLQQSKLMVPPLAKWGIGAVALIPSFGCQDPPHEAESTSPSAKTIPAPSQEPSPAPVASHSNCSPACAAWQQCRDGRCRPDCPDGRVYIPSTGPAGFQMGKGPPGAFDQAHQVILTEGFCMDATEVTVSAYRRCVERGACAMPELRDINSNYREEYDRLQHPINMVNWRHAQKYCQAQGGSLPTEAQWEWAAGHGDGRLYPWGNEPDPTCDNKYADFTPNGSPQTDPAGDVGCRGGGTSEVKSHPLGKTTWPAGDLYDLAGNVWEWTSDCYLPYPRDTQTDPSPQSHPALRGDCYVRSLRGGGWNRSRFALRPHNRAGSKRTYQVPGLGFRCVSKPTS